MFAILLATGCNVSDSPISPGHTRGGGDDEPPPADAGGAEDPGRGDSGDDEVDGRDLLFADGVIHDVHIELDDANWNAMQADWTRTVHATLTIDDDPAQDVGIHRKGSSTLRGLGQKAAFSIDFSEWVPDQRWRGVHHLALNNMVLDASMMREHAAAWVYERLGVPAARHGYGRVYVNGELWGLYGLVESADQRFLKERWKDDDTGWLYDSVWNTGDVTRAAEANFTVAEEGDTGVAFDDLHQLVDTVESTPADGALAMLQARFDADEFLMAQATDIVLGDYDAYWFNKNNYLLYHAPTADRWHMVSWGPDQAFVGNGPVHDAYNGRLDALCRTDRACMAILDDDMRAVAQAMIDDDLAGYVEQTWALIQDDCEHDPKAERPCDRGTLVDFIKWRPAYVLSQLGG